MCNNFALLYPDFYLDGLNFRVARGKLKIYIDVNFFFGGVLLGPYPRHMEVPRLGVETELQLPAYATATATRDPSCVFDLRHSSRQHQILNPRSQARDQTSILMDASRVH